MADVGEDGAAEWEAAKRTIVRPGESWRGGESGAQWLRNTKGNISI